MSEASANSSRWRPRLGRLLVFALMLGPTGAIPVRAEPGVRITYVARVAPSTTLRLCVGESRDMSVRIDREIERAGGSTASFKVSGGRIGGAIADKAIGHFDPRSEERRVSGPPESRALFKFVADAPGRTTIDFLIVATGEELTLGRGWPKQHAALDVEVTPCYMANTSGLATVFTQADMGGLNTPFLLSGYTPNTTGVQTETQHMFFVPNPQNRLSGGHYLLIDTATTTLGGRQGECTAYLSGRYDVAFYIPEGSAVPPGADVGDLMMMGRGTMICQGRPVLNIDYGSSYGFHISFKPRPPSGGEEEEED